jgi:hypothetical protein
MRAWRITKTAVLAAGLLTVPIFAAEPAQPGMVNYIEGGVRLNGLQLTPKSVGNAVMGAGDELTTATGKAEVLLTPGIYLRVDDQSVIKMISPDLARTQVDLEHGRAGVEVDQIFPANSVQIIDNGVTTQLIKPGYYEFDANHPELLVFKGRAEVFRGDGRWLAVKDHHVLALSEGARLKAVDFNPYPANDELYNWSSLRSEYLAEANNQIAYQYGYAPGFYPGWYWNPWSWGYTFVGWNPFLSPFGWDFYPWGGYGGWWGPRWYGFYGHSSFYGHGFHGGIHGGGFGGMRGGR